MTRHCVPPDGRTQHLQVSRSNYQDTDNTEDRVRH